MVSFVFTAVFMLVSSISSYAQQAIRDYLGRPIESKNYLDVKGSPYLFDEWTEGWVKLHNGNMHAGMSLKYDQVQDNLLFKGSSGQAQAFVEPVIEFEIDGHLFRKGYTPVDGAAPAAFYQVLADGNTQFLKRTTKQIFEEVPYGTATKQKTIAPKEFYYLSLGANDNLVKIRKDKKAIVNALSDKKAQLEQYIKQHSLDMKEEADLAKLVAYYNTL